MEDVEFHCVITLRVGIMTSRIVNSIALAAFINFAIGCASTTIVTYQREDVNISNPDSGNAFSENKIVEVELVTKDTLIYDDDGGRYTERYADRDSVIVGMTVEGKQVVTPFRDVARVSVEGSAKRYGVVPVLIACGIVALLAVGVSQFGSLNMGWAN
jgi:hypothetical protein